ncbi:unnamed protein product [Brachionus calyciflorus]|uniref:WSC domain-containing protein n=1 Tax=Brachionus calyciflorus TaxID=104777 RepID=A0A814AXJ1_9BILA|nr:unnamed protein product [Brachionus calyciflorus]
MRYSFKFSSNEHPNKCYDECFQRGYQYAATRKLNFLENLCLCDDRYDTYHHYTKTPSSCNCQCGDSLITYCGCEHFNRVVKVIKRFINTELVGYSLGCFKMKKAFSLDNNTLKMNQDNCSQFCFINSGKNFSAVNLEGGCFCNDLIFQSKKISNSFCDKNYESNNRIAKITQILTRTLKIEFEKKVFVNKSFDCALSLSTDIEFFEIFIDFNFKKYQLILNGSKELETVFNFKYTVEGTYNINVLLSKHKMNVQTVIYVYGENMLNFYPKDQKSKENNF